MGKRKADKKAFSSSPQKAPIFILQDGDDRAAQPGRGRPPAQELPQVGQQGDGGGGVPGPGEEDADDDDVKHKLMIITMMMMLMMFDSGEPRDAGAGAGCGGGQPRYHQCGRGGEGLAFWWFVD